MRILRGNAGGARDESVGILLGPPILEVALGVELAALVVEAVRQLVADGGAGVAVVGRVVHLRIVERRLQHAGRKIDVVHLRVVVGVDRGRRHPPLAAIYRLADLGELAAVFEEIATRGVARIVVRRDDDGTVVAPLVRVTDLIHHAMEFIERLLFGRAAHPGELLDVGFHGLFDLARHGDRAGFGLGGKCLFHEHLAKSLAEVPIYAFHTALPARLHLFHVAQVLAVEIEIRGDKRLTQIARTIIHQVPAQIGLPIGRRARFDQLLDFTEELGFGDVDHRGRGEADGLPVLRPGEMRRQLLEIGR